ncbi:peptidase C1B, bleomycin hydrolase [Pseudohyphozyma bogoriensis]|nr:peptidase C1B, bleomycin hydrolase [Pseudohyphozyma bogoriensis]
MLPKSNFSWGPHDWTPRSLADEINEQFDLRNTLLLGNDPRSWHPFNAVYSSDGSTLVLAQNPRVYKFINLRTNLLRRAALRTLADGLPVWFGMHLLPPPAVGARKSGNMDGDTTNVEQMFGIDTSMTKAERLQCFQSSCTHAMVIVGYEEERDPKTGQLRMTSWKVENSWGTGVGIQGFFAMTDKFFEDYVFLVAARRSDVQAFPGGDQLLNAYDHDVLTLLPRNDPLA